MRSKISFFFIIFLCHVVLVTILLSVISIFIPQSSHSWQLFLILFILPLPFLYLGSRTLYAQWHTPLSKLVSTLAQLSQKKWGRALTLPKEEEWRLAFQALNQIRIALREYQSQLVTERKREEEMVAISLILTRFAPPEKTFPQLLPHLSALLHAQAALFLRKDHTLVEFAEDHPPFAVKIGEGIAGLCAKQKEKVIANRASSHPNFVEGETPFRHLFCLPLLAGDELLGVVSFFRLQDPPFTEEEVSKVEPVVRLLSAYLQNILLQEKLILEPKTGLFVYPYFLRKCEEEWQRAHRYRIPFSIVLFDLDFFKKVNDVHGHLVGDQVLLGLAKLIKEEIRDLDIACRFGGEEFAILLPSTDIAAAHACAERIRKRVAHASLLPNGECITISAGVASSGATVTEMIEQADQALYQAKGRGRNCVCAYLPTQKCEKR